MLSISIKLQDIKIATVGMATLLLKHPIRNSVLLFVSARERS